VKVEELLSKARDTLSVTTVYGPAVEQDGITVIPAARVAGGGGAGTGQDEGGPEGEGGGFGMMAKPAGAYVIDHGKVSWQPAIDPARMVWAVAAVILALVAARAVSAPWRRS
jgi:uncharacterized spore protein YtfJ